MKQYDVVEVDFADDKCRVGEVYADSLEEAKKKAQEKYGNRVCYGSWLAVRDNSMPAVLWGV